jgi:mannose-1-phosphate guanylyltransferase
VVRDLDVFRRTLADCCTAAERTGGLVTIGIVPTRPETGYGYIHRGADAGIKCRTKIYSVESFMEKPDETTAEEYLRSGEYYWNSGMFAWRVAAILAEIERLLPENARVLAELAADWERVGGTSTGAERFGQLRKISVDFGVMEKTRNALVVEMNCDWKDLGSWISVASTRTPDGAGNVALAPQVLLVDAANNIVVSELEHLVVALGVSNLVVVHSADATLICRREDVERIKELGALREERFGDRFE